MTLEEVPGRDLLRQLLREYNEHPRERERIEWEIHRQFRRTAAVLVVDSSGFTRNTRASGIVHFLALLERLQRAVIPYIERDGGQYLRAEADNTFSLFENVEDAVSCAAEIQRYIEAANEVLPAEEEIYISIAIGHGSLLVIGTEDVYGDEMNLACKLGEDLAERGEVLLTEAAFQALGESQWKFEEQRFSVSGIQVVAYRLLWRQGRIAR